MFENDVAKEIDFTTIPKIMWVKTLVLAALFLKTSTVKCNMNCLGGNVVKATVLATLFWEMVVTPMVLATLLLEML